MPKDAASAAGKASINDRSPSGRIHGSKGKKVRLARYACKVDAALRPILAGQPMPLPLVAAEPLASIYRQVDTSLSLVVETIPGNPDRVTDLDLAAAAAARGVLGAAEVAGFRNLLATRVAQRRTTTDLALAARAVTQGAVDSLLIDIDEVIPGTVDETSGVTAFGRAQQGRLRHRRRDRRSRPRDRYTGSGRPQERSPGRGEPGGDPALPF